MVIYEGANALCGLPNVTQRELTPAITVLQLFLCSSKPTLRFAAVRTLNRIAMIHPSAVTPCNMDMEGLINDSNRSIATLAITTLLKTGSESGVERLMKQITSFMCEIADEFKVIVVDAIRAMCIKFPQKHRLLMTFLSNMLREEGGFAYKKAIVDTILHLIGQIPDAKEAGLMHLCEFIEDCEFTALSTSILHLLGKEGPQTSEPSSYIRFIYNRVVLENATVRASAVSALAKFGVQLPALRESIVTLLQRCLHDNDDEVRDRATFYCKLLTKMDTSPDNVLGLNPIELVLKPLPVPLIALEHAVQEYLAAPSEQPFSVFNVTMSAEMIAAERKAAQEQVAAAGRHKSDDDYGAPTPSKAQGKGASASAAAAEADLISKMPQFVHVGQRFGSSKPLALTDPETEYAVSCTKHVYAQHTILAFDLKNTLEDQLLQSVCVQLDLSGCAGVELEAEVPCTELPYGQPSQAYVCLRRAEAAPTGSLGCTLKFVVREVDASTGGADASSAGYEDEYALEELELSAADYMKPIMIADFRGNWEVRVRAPPRRVRLRAVASRRAPARQRQRHSTARGGPRRSPSPVPAPPFARRASATAGRSSRPSRSRTTACSTPLRPSSTSSAWRCAHAQRARARVRPRVDVRGRGCADGPTLTQRAPGARPLGCTPPRRCARTQACRQTARARTPCCSPASSSRACRCSPLSTCAPRQASRWACGSRSDRPTRRLASSSRAVSHRRRGRGWVAVCFAWGARARCSLHVNEAGPTSAVTTTIGRARARSNIQY